MFFVVQLASWTFQQMPVIFWLVLAGCFQCDGGYISPFDKLMDQQFHMQSAMHMSIKSNHISGNTICFDVSTRMLAKVEPVIG